jgi:hypothetical protein
MQFRNFNDSNNYGDKDFLDGLAEEEYKLYLFKFVTCYLFIYKLKYKHPSFLIQAKKFKMNINLIGF